MALAEITDMVERARERVLAQYRSLTTRFLPMLDVFIGEAQELEAAFWDMVAQLNVDTATGIWLDRVGYIVGEPREGETDDNIYRGYIKARIVANRSSGTINELLALTNQVLGSPAVTLSIMEWFPASLTMTIPQGVLLAYGSTVRLRLLRLLGRARAAGVSLEVFTQAFADSATFTFSSTSALQASLTVGYADTTDPTVGGHFRDIARA